MNLKKLLNPSERDFEEPYYNEVKELAEVNGWAMPDSEQSVYKREHAAQEGNGHVKRLTRWQRKQVEQLSTERLDYRPLRADRMTKV